jgi:hypothetical protein
MPSDKVRRLQEYGKSITRLAIPAAYRDELGLSDGHIVALRSVCQGTEPAVVIDAAPENPDPERPTHRPVQVDNNGQATVNFPRVVADLHGWLGQELELSVAGDEIQVTRHK